MHYEINVSKDGQHLFATHERSIQSIYQLEPIVKIFKEKFLKSEGYDITVTEWKTQGQQVNIDSV